MEAVKEIKKLRDNANEIYDLFTSKIPKWSADKKRYDKIGWGFNKDSRFNACNPSSIAFSSHMGTYGDSGCSSQCQLDYEVFNKHLLLYLNRNVEAVMLAIAKQIEVEAQGLKSKAEAELNSQLEKLKELENI